LKRSRPIALILLAGALAVSGCGGSGNGFNDTPAITNLFPSNIVAGSQDFTLSVVGTGFIANSRGVTFVYWNGSPRSTILNSSTGQLQAQISAADVASATIAAVTVISPGPGGGESADSAFTITSLQNGAPTISSFSPPSAKAGGQGFTLTVNGTNFAVNDPVTWNGSVRATTFVTQNQVTAVIDPSDILTPGFGSVAVNTPGLVVASPSINFPITGPNNAAPSVGSLSPTSTAAGGSDFELTVSGSNFVSSSTVEWNGVPVATAFLGSSRLVALITAADIASSGSVDVGVTNPPPGGGTSKTVAFTIK